MATYSFSKDCTYPKSDAGDHAKEGTYRMKLVIGNRTVYVYSQADNADGFTKCLEECKRFFNGGMADLRAGADSNHGHTIDAAGTVIGTLWAGH